MVNSPLVHVENSSVRTQTHTHITETQTHIHYTHTHYTHTDTYMHSYIYTYTHRQTHVYKQETHQHHQNSAYNNSILVPSYVQQYKIGYVSELIDFIQWNLFPIFDKVKKRIQKVATHNSYCVRHI